MSPQELRRIALDFFDQAKDIDAASVPIDDRVRDMCAQNACGYFGKCWTCPPAIESLETLRSRLSGYDRFMIFHKVYALEDSFDWEGMARGLKAFQASVLKFRKKLASTAPGERFLVLGAGACRLCQTCSYQEEKPCQHPEDAIISVEAYGIDVMKMMAENRMKYNNGANTVTYVGGVFWRPGPS